MSWVAVSITNTDGTAAAEGSYYRRYNKEWSPQEAVVEAGTSEIQLKRVNGQAFLMQPNMKLGAGGAPLIRSDLTRAQITPSPSDIVHAVETVDVTPPRAPPEDVLATLDGSQREAFARLWQRVPLHLHEIHFDFEKPLWTAADIGALGDLLCKYEHRFSHHSTDLGHVTVDPFRIILKTDARPVKRRPYRHSPVLAAKVKTEIDKLVLAGILRRSYSNWLSPLVVIAKADGTCNYKRVNEQSMIPVMPLPTIDDLLSDLGGARVQIDGPTQQIFPMLDTRRLYPPDSSMHTIG
ncbi:unnamed protein product [Laminaria digitata]